MIIYMIIYMQTTLDPEYHQCGWETIERTSSADPQDNQYQRAVNVHLSGVRG